MDDRMFIPQARSNQRETFWSATPHRSDISDVSITPMRSTAKATENPFLAHKSPLFNSSTAQQLRSSSLRSPAQNNNLFVGGPILDTPPREFVERNARSKYTTQESKVSAMAIPGVLPDEPTGDFSMELEESVEDTVANLKLQVETLITAIMMVTPSTGSASKSSAACAIQGYDAIEVSHRIMTRLKLLREENEHLAQWSNGLHAAKLEAQNARLTEENEQLRTQLAEHDKKKRIVGSLTHSST